MHLTRSTVIDAFADHLTAVSPCTPGPLTRITQ
jgi:hypothetical protein